MSLDNPYDLSTGGISTIPQSLQYQQQSLGIGDVINSVVIGGAKKIITGLLANPIKTVASALGVGILVANPITAPIALPAVTLFGLGASGLGVLKSISNFSSSQSIQGKKDALADLGANGLSFGLSAMALKPSLKVGYANASQATQSEILSSLPSKNISDVSLLGLVKSNAKLVKLETTNILKNRKTLFSNKSIFLKNLPSLNSVGQYKDIFKTGGLAIGANVVRSTIPSSGMTYSELSPQTQAISANGNCWANSELVDDGTGIIMPQACYLRQQQGLTPISPYGNSYL